MRLKTCFCLLSVVLLLSVVALAQSTRIELKEGKYQIDVIINGKPFTTYLHTPDPSKPLLAPGILQTKPVLHPVLSPSGIALTRAYPFTEVPGESRDHPHHMGIYFTMDRVGSDANNFWGNSREPLPAIKHVKVTSKKEGSQSAALKTVSKWVGKDGKPVVTEDREMVFMVLDPSTYAIDFNMALQPVSGEVSFGDTKEGMFAFRVAEFLTEKATGRYLNSEGGELEKGVWGKRANWVRLQGETGGKKIGIVILNHPTSTNSPTYWHARGYGCFSVNPLGQLDFQKAHKEPDPKPLDLKLKPGEKAWFKYRVVVYEGDFGKDKVDELYKAYAK
ncbi:MAG: PmoA family protein [Acidobacteriota bacterium]